MSELPQGTNEWQRWDDRKEPNVFDGLWQYKFTITGFALVCIGYTQTEVVFALGLVMLFLGAIADALWGILMMQVLIASKPGVIIATEPVDEIKEQYKEQVH